jgi:uroporphyrinogen-III synthase
MLPLTGRRILVTRSRQQASELAAQLEALGGTTILIPTIEIAPPSSYAPLDEAITRIDSFDWIVFTSANAVNVFCERTPQRNTPQIAVIGPSTARVAQAAGLKVDLVPKQAVAESLLEALLPQIVPGSRVLLIRAAVARNELPEALTHAGAEVRIVEAYRTVVPPASVEALCRLFTTELPDAITFTSSSTATNLVALMEAGGLALPPQIVRASIGPITSATLRTLGLPPLIEAAESTTTGLADALANHFAIS